MACVAGGGTVAVRTGHDLVDSEVVLVVDIVDFVVGILDHNLLVIVVSWSNQADTDQESYHLQYYYFLMFCLRTNRHLSPEE